MKPQLIQRDALIMLFLFFSMTQLTLAQDIGFSNPKPYGNYFSDIEFIPGTSTVVTTSQNSCAILKSVDFGQSWAINCNDIDEVAENGYNQIYFLNRDTAYLISTFENYKSIDGGNTWSLSNLPNAGEVFDIDFNENGLGVAVTNGSKSISLTKDWGQNWERIELNLQFTSVSVLNNNRIILGTSDEGLYYSTDMLNSVTKSQNHSAWVSEIQFIDDMNGVFVSAPFLGASPAAGYTEDSGNTWNISLNLDEYSGDLSINENGQAFLSTSKNVFYSENAGRSWEERIDVNEYFDETNRDFTYNIEGITVYDQTVIIAGDYGFMAKSTDLGATWELLSEHITTADILSLYQEDEQTLACSTKGLMRSMDKGESWNIIEDSDYDFFFMDRLDNGSLIGLTTRDEAYISDDKGENWEEISDFGNGSFISDEQAKILPDGSIIIIARKGFAVRSFDNGQTWQTIEGPFLDNEYSLYSVDFLDENIGIIGSSSNRIFRTEDGGSTWADISIDESNNKSVIALEMLDIDNIIAYRANWTFRSTDGGQSYVRIDQENNDIVTFDAEGKGVRQDGPKVFVTNDFGENWTLASKVLPSVFWNDGNAYIYGEDIWLTGIDGLIWKACNVFDLVATSRDPLLNESLTFKLFPNPANQQLFINSEGTNLATYDISVFNANGQLVLSQKSNTIIDSVNIESLESGLYLVQISSGTKIYTRKVIVDKF